MSPKTPRSAGSKEKGKKKDVSSSEESSTATGAGHPDSIFPLVLTSATQELFSCRADEDVTAENPHKLLKKSQIIQDMKTRAAVSDFSPIKQAVLDYPEDEMLLVFDRDFTYGQSFYLVLRVEAKENILKPPVVVEEEPNKVEEVEEVMEQKSPEPQSWISLGSEREIDEELVTDTRAKLHYKISRVRREFGAPVSFSDSNAEEIKGNYTECTSYPDKNFSIRRLEQHCGIQAINNSKNSFTQTTWKYPRNMYTQYEARELNEEERENILQSEDLKNFLNSAITRFEVAIQQNEMMDVFVDDWGTLEEVENAYEGKPETHLKVHQSFTALNYSKDKAISYISWHPTISGVIAVATTEQFSFEERIKNSTKLLLNPPLLLLWSVSNPINPQLLLECPDDVLCFEFCPSDPNIIVGGCMNGQVVLWDISGHVEKLQDTRSGVGTKNISNANMLSFDEKQESDTPVVRYSAVSAIEGGHRAPVTDIQWLPADFEVSRMGIPMENKNEISVQVVSCAPDGCVMFWDLRAPHLATQSLTHKKPKSEEKVLENPQRVPDTFKHLNLTWKPLVKVTLPKLEMSGEYSPVKFSLCNTSTAKAASAVDRSEVPNYSVLRQPSAKHQRQLDNISTKFYAGTEDGDIVYADWKQEKDNESGRLYSPKPTHCFRVHDSLVNTVLRSPFYKDVILTVGGWNFAIWKEGVMNGPILLSPCSQRKYTVGFWSLTRPGVFFIGKEDGNLEVWDLLEKTHEALQSQNISSAKISCIRPWIISSKQQLLAVSDHLGTLHVLEVPWTLRHPSPNEEIIMSRYFEKEVACLMYYEKRKEIRAREKKEMDAEEQRRKVETAVVMKQEEDVELKAQKEYEEFIQMENLVLKNLGF
ncbi:dynein axonemal intermediate chain 3 [Trichomycterus rosablanca]|uniref:dynein axonemal intermediate chain 3 n=1 Tax=Trichomycterus rosablanca TaxID=2290929 RepID=UPI002F3537E0